MKPSEIPIFLRTIRHIPPTQVGHRIRLRTKRAVYARYRGDLEARWASKVGDYDVGWPADFQPIDWTIQHEAPRYSEAGRGVFNLVGESHDALRDGWQPTDRSQLFRYHLHYMEWAWPLAHSNTEQARADFAALWRSWRTDTRPGRWDEWSPYVVSLRAWVLCGVFDALARGTELEEDLRWHLRAAASFLPRNLERDVGGNHLIKNLKALVGLGVIFRSDSLITKAQTHLRLQLPRQILDDGGHFELSPSYHTQVLSDLLDIHDLAVSSGLTSLAHTVAPFLLRMVNWLSDVRLPDNSLPALGDCTQPLSGLLEELDRRRPPQNPRPLAHLESSGYLVIRPLPNTVVVFDFGSPCPLELPAHAQADWGTFEIWYERQKLVTDPGTSAYTGPRRTFERSTRAHNTAFILDLNQTEVWGSFRAARRHKPLSIEVSKQDDSVLIKAAVEYRRRIHERLVLVEPTALHITDRITPSREIRQSILIPLQVYERSQIQVRWDTAVRIRTTQSAFAETFGDTQTAMRLDATAASPSSFHVIYAMNANE